MFQVSRRAKVRGLPQLGTLGAGNHYAEIQVVEEVFNEQAAKRMGIDRVGQVRDKQAYIHTWHHYTAFQYIIETFSKGLVARR